MGRFKITDLIEPINNNNFEQVNDIKKLDIYSIIPSEQNFYYVSDIEELADAILQVGLMENLVVEINSDNQYILLSGHRRHLALKKLVESGYTEFQFVACKIIRKKSEELSELSLILANSTTRILSDYESMHQAIRIKQLLKQAKENGTIIKGRLRDVTAESLKISNTKMAQYENIYNNLTDDLMQEFKNGNIKLSAAYKIASQSKNKQTDKQMIKQNVHTRFDVIKSMSIKELAEYFYISNSKLTDLDYITKWLKGVD